MQDEGAGTGLAAVEERGRRASGGAGTPRTDQQTVEEKEGELRMKEGPGAWFVKTGCFVCHSISALGVKSPAQIGPDLSTAVEDVQSRFGRTVDDFLDVLAVLRQLRQWASLSALFAPPTEGSSVASGGPWLRG